MKTETRELKGKSRSKKQEKPKPTNYTGTVKKFFMEKGYGFIQIESGNRKFEGEDAFVHHSDIFGGGRQNLIQGETVQFNIHETAKGLRAVDVLRIEGVDVLLAEIH